MDIDYDFSSHKCFCADAVKCPLAEKCKRAITPEEENQMSHDGKMIWFISYLSQDGGDCKHFSERKK